MAEHPARDLLPFVPARDFARSQVFYRELGWECRFANDQVARFRLGTAGFLLQNYYVKELAENFMLSLTVDDADAWWARLTALDLPGRYPGITFKPPTVQPWGLRILFLSDPTGVLWHLVDGKAGG